MMLSPVCWFLLLVIFVIGTVFALWYAIYGPDDDDELRREIRRAEQQEKHKHENR